jgi:hypothetical protein
VEVAGPTHVEHEIGVLAAAALEVRAKVERGSLEFVVAAQEQRDEQTPDATVAVPERVDCLELIMNERGSYEEREILRPAS